MDPGASQRPAMDFVEAVKPVKEFAKNSYRLVNKCTKPDGEEGPPLHAGVASSGCPARKTLFFTGRPRVS